MNSFPRNDTHTVPGPGVEQSHLRSSEGRGSEGWGVPHTGPRCCSMAMDDMLPGEEHLGGVPEPAGLELVPQGPEPIHPNVPVS